MVIRRWSKVRDRSAVIGKAGMKLLIIEDSPLVRQMYRLAFSGREHDLVEAENGLEALDALATASDPFAVVKKPWKPQEILDVVQSVGAANPRRDPEQDGHAR
jgi:ActR/RegA family two-component response regulator